MARRAQLRRAGSCEDAGTRVRGTPPRALRARVRVLPMSDDLLPDDPLWFKDAIIYEIHIRAFQDSTNDGIGDLNGLISRLDYPADLGGTAIWLLPFSPSPRRAGGYDIADYTNVHPSYGTRDDVARLLREA